MGEVKRETIIAGIAGVIGVEAAKDLVKESEDEVENGDVMKIININKAKDLSEEAVTNIATFLTQIKYLDKSMEFVECGKKFGIFDPRTMEKCRDLKSETAECADDFIASTGHKRYYNEEDHQKLRAKIQKELEKV